MTIQLRPYQVDAKTAALDVLASQDKTFIRIPTGGGKTVVAASVAEDLISSGANILFLQHREELIQQNKATMELVTGARCTVVKGRVDDWSGDVVFASVATAKGKRLAASPEFSHIFIDECHRAHAKTYQNIIDHNGDAKVLGLTATPDRKTFKTFGLPAFHISIERLIQLGSLVRPRGRTIDLGVSRELASLKGTEVQIAAEASRRLNVGVLNSAVVDGWLREAAGLKTILFASSVNHAVALQAAFNNRGVPANIITGNTSTTERQSYLYSLATGEVPVLINCMVLTEGVDVPEIECVAIDRPMKSKVLFVQAVGRGLRLADGKSSALVLDYVGACETHGGLEMALGVLPTKKRAAPTKECPKCSERVATSKKKCPACGEKFPVAVKSKTVVSAVSFKDVGFGLGADEKLPEGVAVFEKGSSRYYVTGHVNTAYVLGTDVDGTTGAARLDASKGDCRVKPVEHKEFIQNAKRYEEFCAHHTLSFDCSRGKLEKKFRIRTLTILTSNSYAAVRLVCESLAEVDHALIGGNAAEPAPQPKSELKTLNGLKYVPGVRSDILLQVKAEMAAELDARRKELRGEH